MTLRKVHEQTRILTAIRGRDLSYILIGTSLCLLALYAFFLSKTVFNIIVRKNVESNIHTKITDISDLELSFLTKITSIDKEYITSAGYVIPERTYFVSRQTVVGQAPLRDHEL